VFKQCTLPWQVLLLLLLLLLLVVLVLRFAGGRGYPGGGGRRRTGGTVHRFARSLLSYQYLGFRCRSVCIGISFRVYSFPRLCHIRRPTCNSREMLIGLHFSVSVPDDTGRDSFRDVENECKKHTTADLRLRLCPRLFNKALSNTQVT
jgi:hypothetical protein